MSLFDTALTNLQVDVYFVNVEVMSITNSIHYCFHLANFNVCQPCDLSKGQFQLLGDIVQYMIEESAPLAFHLDHQVAFQTHHP